MQCDPETDGWYVPVLRGVEFQNEAEAEAYLLADNRLQENGGWDNKALAEMLKRLDGDFDGTGFDDEDLSALLMALNTAPPPAAETPFPEFPEAPGDDSVVFTFGAHSGRVSAPVYAAFVEAYQRDHQAGRTLDDILAAWCKLAL